MDKKTFFVTNRQLSGSAYQDDLSPNFQIRFGGAMVRADNGRYTLQSHETYKEQGPTTSDRNRGVSKWRVLGSDEAGNEIQKQMQAQGAKDVLIFIHGASNTFELCIETATRLATIYEKHSPIIPIAFSYPTNNAYDPLNYVSDVLDARSSGPHIARAIQRMIAYLRSNAAACECPARITLVAHSLGNHALSAAVSHIREYRVFQSARVFDNVILAHADEDEDALVEKSRLLHLSTLSDEISIYYDRADVLLRLSDRTEIFNDRLGRIGPKPHPGPTFNGCKINAIDCGEVTVDEEADTKRHSHYIHSEAVVADIKAQIAHEPSELRKPKVDEAGQFYLTDQA